MSEETKLQPVVAPAPPWGSAPWIREGCTVYAQEHYGWARGVEEFQNRFYMGVQGPHTTPKAELEAVAMLTASAPVLYAALKQIGAIPNKSDGGDWDEIEEAREIAEQALGSIGGPRVNLEFSPAEVRFHVEFATGGHRGFGDHDTYEGALSAQREFNPVVDGPTVIVKVTTLREVLS